MQRYWRRLVTRTTHSLRTSAGGDYSLGSGCVSPTRHAPGLQYGTPISGSRGGCLMNEDVVMPSKLAAFKAATSLNELFRPFKHETQQQLSERE